MSEETYLRIKQLCEEINNEKTRGIARLAGNTSSWTRKRKMPLSDILACTLAKKGLSTVMELRDYFQKAEKVEHMVSKQDYLKQRQQLNPEVFKVLNRNYLKRFYDGKEVKTWNGYIVLGEDGSRAEIPDSTENRLMYGCHENKYGKTVARAIISTLYDTENRFILDIGIHKYASGEIAAAKENIAALKEIAGGRNILILCDRGYTSLEFMNFLEKEGLYYLIRLRSDAFQAELPQMQGRDEWVELVHTHHRLHHYKKTMPDRGKEMSEQHCTAVRIVRTKFATDEKGILATNVKEGGTKDIQRLYRRRWKLEQKFHTLKNKMKFESVTGKAGIYVQQDFLAQVLVFNIVQDLITAAERRAAKKSKKKRHKYAIRINENIAIGLFKEQFITLMLPECEHLKGMLFRKLIADIEKYIVPVRFLKSAPRKWKPENKYKCNQKPSF